MKKPLPSAERTELREAIAAARYATESRNAAIAAESSAASAVRDAERAVEDARAALADAKVVAGQQTEAALLGAPVASPGHVRIARDALTDAEDTRDAAIAARDGLNLRRHDDDGYVERTQRRLSSAALAVVHAEGLEPGMALAAEVISLQCQLVAKSDAVMWFANNMVFPSVEGYSGYTPRPADDSLRLALQRLASPPTTWTELLRDPANRGSGPWVAWLAALMTDADAPLPDA